MYSLKEHLSTMTTELNLSSTLGTETIFHTSYIFQLKERYIPGVKTAELGQT